MKPYKNLWRPKLLIANILQHSQNGRTAERVLGTRLWRERASVWTVPPEMWGQGGAD